LKIPPANAMPLTDSATFTDRLRAILERYDERLLRQVANKLCKPRNQWPAEELIDRCLATIGNAAMIDRRLADLDAASAQLLSLVGRSRQACWTVGSLVEMAVALGHDDGLRPIITLLEAGLLYPELPAKGSRLKSFDLWLGQSSGRPATVIAPADITARALSLPVNFPSCSGQVVLNKPTIYEADGLDFPLRIAGLWQIVQGNPLRRTQNAGFFKRDCDRLVADPVLNAAAQDVFVELPDAALLVVALAAGEKILLEVEGELRAGDVPAGWDDGLPSTIASLWTTLLHQGNWNSARGWCPEGAAANPYPSTWLLALVLLGQLPADAWISVEGLENWMNKHHPFWRVDKNGCSLASFFLGIAFPLGLVQATRAAKDSWSVRLSSIGKWLLGLGPLPETSSFPQTLLVQPNLEILAYRQGLTPALIARLSKLANWKTLGAACTLQLEPASVYRALEAGESFETILQTLQCHGMKPTPETVVNALRTWATKRERIRVYTVGALFEFNTAEDLADALARGLQAVKLSDRLAIVANDQEIDYRHFRLMSTRDYALPPERCVEVDPDGVTLAVDLAKSDLLIETEVARFAESLESSSTNGKRHYRLTPLSLAQGRGSGLSLPVLESWFQQRSGQPLPAASRLLLLASQLTPYEFRRPLVLQVPTAEMADGLMQWPETKALIQSRLGPTALTVDEDKLQALRERLDALGVRIPADG
jgi:hypothetical protein